MIIGSNLPTNSLASLQAIQILSQSTAQSGAGASLLSTGSAATDTTGVSLLDNQLSSLDSAQQEVSSGLSFTQTQDAYLQQISTALTGMSQLAQLAADPAATDAERAGYQSQFSQLSASISDIASKDFNGVSLFSGTSIDVQSESGTMNLSGVDLGASGYADALDASLGSASGAQDALGKVTNALDQLSQDRSGIDSNLSRLNSAADQLSVGKENLNAAISAIQDSDSAVQIMQNAVQSLLSQSGDAMLAQANAMPQDALRLSS